LPCLTDLTLINCRGDSVVSLLSATASNLTKLKLCKTNHDLPAHLYIPNFLDLELIHVDNLFAASILPKAPKVQKLRLREIAMVSFQNLSSLRELSIGYCKGDISSAINQVANSLTKLEIDGVELKDKITAKFTKLREFSIIDCRGDMISSAFNQAIPSLTKLQLLGVELMDKLTLNLPNLQILSIVKCKGDISSLLSEAAPTVTHLTLAGVDMNIEIKKAFAHVKVANIDSQMIDINKCPQVLTTTGKLEDLFKNSRKRKQT